MARLLFAPEELPEDPPPAAPARARRKVLSLLFAPEPLPEAEAPAPPGRGRGTLSLLLAPEELPPAPEEPAPGPADAPRGRGRWLEWLFKPEKLDPS